MDDPAATESTQPADTQASEALGGTWPERHFWATNDSNFDLSQAKPHACMTDLVQRGNYVHCVPGNHGMAIPFGKMLVKDPQTGKYDLVDMAIHDAQGQKTEKTVADTLAT